MNHLETGAAPIELSFDDNGCVQMLVGPGSQNLARIEQLLGVVVRQRGNQFRVTGPASHADAARKALVGLYGKIERGQAVEMGDVDAAVRFAEEGERDGPDLFGEEALAIRTRKRHVAPRSANQAQYLRLLKERDLTFALGPAGTGKTYLAVAAAVEMLTLGKVDRIVLSRPAVEAGERLGFLPGDVREKVDPYLRPLYDALYDMMPGEQVARRLTSGEIEIAPLAFMRGRTLANACVIVDEAQNTTPMQMKMLLTRLGENSRMVVTGDLTQIDLPSHVTSGLRDALDVLEGMQGVVTIHFSHGDVVRHELVARITRAYDDRDGKQVELNLEPAAKRRGAR